MSMEELGESLIFLVSQPRSGSTLLQRILGSHPDIHTMSEPWLMLHPFYALKEEGWQAEYDARFAQKALTDFLKTLPDGVDDYFEGVRRMYGYLYRRALGRKRFFLDKTPRYYAVLPELHRTFPAARFLILFRNPLAVLHSIFNTSLIQENLLAFYWVQNDLIRAVSCLLDGVERLGDQCLTVRYEELVREPEREVRRICDWLGIEFSPAMVEYGSHALPRWSFGDQAVYDRSRPDPQLADRWQDALCDPQFWRLAHDYLQLLGRETVERMGYPYEELRQLLDARRPSQMQLWFTFSAHWLFQAPPEHRPRWQRTWVWLVGSVRRRGVWTTLGALRDKILRPPSTP